MLSSFRCSQCYNCESSRDHKSERRKENAEKASTAPVEVGLIFDVKIVDNLVEYVQEYNKDPSKHVYFQIERDALLRVNCEQEYQAERDLK